MWERVEWVFAEAFGRIAAVLASDLPGIVAMLLVVVAAIVAAWAIRGALRFGLARVGFDRRAREWGITSGHGLDPHHEPSWLVARGAFWLVVATGVAVALAVLGASTTSALGLQLLALLPRLVVGALVLVAGVGAARFLERGVLIGAVNHGIRQARVVAWGVKWIVLALAAAMALQHVGVGGLLPTIAFSIVAGGAVLGGALAFGLGARDAVARSLDRPPTPPEDAAAKRATGERIHHL